jgi:hypothetical protein
MVLHDDELFEYVPPKRTNIDFEPSLLAIIEDTEEEEDDEGRIDSSSDAGFNDDNIDSEGISDGKIAAPPKQSDNAATDTPQSSSKPPRRRSVLCKLKIKDTKAKRKREELALENHQHFFQSSSMTCSPISQYQWIWMKTSPAWKKKHRRHSREPQLTALFRPGAPSVAPVIMENPEEEDDESHIDSSLDDGFNEVNIDSEGPTFALTVENPFEDTSNDQIAAPIEQSENAAADTPSDGMGSGCTEYGKRYSLRQAKRLPDEEDAASTEALGSGMTEKGRRFSRRVANQGSGAN